MNKLSEEITKRLFCMRSTLNAEAFYPARKYATEATCDKMARELAKAIVEEGCRMTECQHTVKFEMEIVAITPDDLIGLIRKYGSGPAAGGDPLMTAIDTGFDHGH